MLKAFRENGLETRIVQRKSYTHDDINWSNCVFTAGGDGTFLMASAKINSNAKPVIGINTDVSKYSQKEKEKPIYKFKMSM